MNIDVFKGLGVAMITPFDEEYNVDIDALRSLTATLVNSGADYLVVMGTTEKPHRYQNKSKKLYWLVL